MRAFNPRDGIGKTVVKIVLDDVGAVSDEATAGCGRPWSVAAQIDIRKSVVPGPRREVLESELGRVVRAGPVAVALAREESPGETGAGFTDQIEVSTSVNPITRK